MGRLRASAWAENVPLSTSISGHPTLTTGLRPRPRSTFPCAQRLRHIQHRAFRVAVNAPASPYEPRILPAYAFQRGRAAANWFLGQSFDAFKQLRGASERPIHNQQEIKVRFNRQRRGFARAGRWLRSQNNSDPANSANTKCAFFSAPTQNCFPRPHCAPSFRRSILLRLPSQCRSISAMVQGARSAFTNAHVNAPSRYQKRRGGPLLKHSPLETSAAPPLFCA